MRLNKSKMSWQDPGEDLKGMDDTMFEAIKALDFRGWIDYILDSKPAAPLPQGMRNSVGFCFIGGLATLLLSGGLS